MALCFLKRGDKKDECLERKERLKLIKHGDPNADLLLAQAAVAKNTQVDEESKWSPLATAGVVGAGLLGIALMVVIIKKAKAGK
jgi:hypothetical protein